jgi:hypothetical protein
MFDGDCSLGGGGWCARVPLPLVESLIDRQIARKNRWLGPRTRPICRARSRPPPMTKIYVQQYSNIEANL